MIDSFVSAVDRPVFPFTRCLLSRLSILYFFYLSHHVSPSQSLSQPYDVPADCLPSSLFANLLIVLFARKECVSCSNNSPPCPSCEEGHVCTMISRSCDQCATTKCVPISTGDKSDSSNKDSGDNNAGAIAGGVIGGVAFVAIATFLVWWFFIRKKRQQSAEGGRVEKLTGDARSRKSTHSIASTVRTRASNVIQIAYIPGVTNRSPPETPGPNSLVPPVPPLPGAAPDQHFFMPGDLRDSSWSDMTDSRSVAPSLRSSVATTIYRNNAVVSPMPAQQATMTRAAVVNINGGNGSSPRAVHMAPPGAPAVPAITPDQLAKAGITDSNSSIVARGMTAKPVMVKGAGPKNNAGPSTSSAIQEQTEPSSSETTSPTPNTQFGHEQSTFAISSSEDEDHSSKLEAETHSTAAREGPFQDPETTDATSSTLNHQDENKNSAQRHRKSASSGLVVNDVNEQQSNRCSQVLARVESPFSDANELR